MNDQDKKKKQAKGKYGSETAIRLREKITGEDRSEEMKADCANILQNHYNACYSDFAKRSLQKIIESKKAKSLVNI